MNKTALTFEQLYKKYKREVLDLVRFRIGDNEIAKELTNDIFLKFAKNHAKCIESGSDEKTFLFRIARSKIIDLSRNKDYIIKNSFDSIHKSFGEEENDTSTVANRLTDESTGADFEIEQSELHEQIKAVFGQIKNEDIKTCLELRYLEGMEYSKIVERTGFSLEKVKVSLNRGLTQLKDLIKDRKSLLKKA